MAACGCGRSPTGQCVGWHSLSEEAFQQKLADYQAKQPQESQEKKDA